MADSLTTDDEPGTIDSGEVRVQDGPITLFGHEPSSATLSLRVRTRRWRLRRAAGPALATLVLTPLVTLVPPHAPWAVGSLVLGVLLTRRRWKEEFTVSAFEGTCPRCGSALELSEGSRLRFPHPLSCDECRHEPVLKLDRETLRDRARERR